MKKRHTLLINAIALALAIGSFNAQACSTVIVGKAVSQTGEIIIGHNEDNGGRILTAQYWVPPQTHKAGEMIRLEPKAAPIPQVEKTLGYYWSQTLDPNGASFSDAFINEKGVMIVSNACSGIYDDDKMPVKDGGVGYALRRLMAERAHSAKQAVDIAIDLLTEYGYFSQGRTYTIADADQAYQLAVHQGNTWVARKIKDDEIVYIPNNFMMDKVDATDKDTWRVAPGTIERAIKNGRYKPAQKGVYKDFNYRVAVAPDARRAHPVNAERNRIAWKYITGKDITDPNAFPYSVKANRKFGVKDVMAILRLQEKEIGDDPGWFHHRSTGVDRATTHESAVVTLRKNPLFIAGWRAYSRPSESPFVPFYPLAQPAKGTAFMPWQTAQAVHFKGIPEYFDYDADWPVWTFVESANTLDYQRDAIAANTQLMHAWENARAHEREAVERRARVLAGVAPEKARAYLHQYNCRLFTNAVSMVGAHTAKIAPHHINVLAQSLNPAGDKTVDIVLYSDDTLDATGVDKARTFAGAGRAAVGNRVVLSDLAKPVQMVSKDVDGDGRADAVFTFRQADVAYKMLPGATYDVWLYTYKDNRRLCAFDTAYIEK